MKRLAMSSGSQLLDNMSKPESGRKAVRLFQLHCITNNFQIEFSFHAAGFQRNMRHRIYALPTARKLMLILVLLEGMLPSLFQIHF